MKSITSLIISILLIAVTGCNKFIEARQDKQLTTPETLQDLQALMDKDANLNQQYPGVVELCSDHFYVTDNDYTASTDNTSKNNYIWNDKDIANINDYQYSYSRVFNCNVVLDNIDRVKLNGAKPADAAAVKGTAYFFRGYTYLKLADAFTLPYDSAKANTMLGLPLKLSSDIDEPIERASLADTWQQVINDLTTATGLLPATTLQPTRPNRAAAFAALAQAYMGMRNYNKAGQYTDSAMAYSTSLIDYNTLNAAAANPFTLFNREVIFQADIAYPSLVSPTYAKVDTVLYASYAANDLRKAIFFKSSTNGTWAFKGGYDGNIRYFSGIATDELYLNKAECAARAGNTATAMSALNTLLKTRWKANTYTDQAAATPSEALNKILAERRKELAFRGGLRWADIRRLNAEPAFAITLTRKINGTLYQLPPGDLRFALLLPYSTIALSGLAQNAR